MPHCLRHLLHLGSLVIVRLMIVTVEAQRVVPAPIVSQPTTRTCQPLPNHPRTQGYARSFAARSTVEPHPRIDPIGLGT